LPTVDLGAAMRMMHGAAALSLAIPCGSGDEGPGDDPYEGRSTPSPERQKGGIGSEL